MTVDSQVALERAVQRIYDEANDYAELHGGVQHGMNVLYGPPILKPRVMMVSVQGVARMGSPGREPGHLIWRTWTGGTSSDEGSCATSTTPAWGRYFSEAPWQRTSRSHKRPSSASGNAAPERKHG